jgi:hypothetical protein
MSFCHAFRTDHQWNQMGASSGGERKMTGGTGPQWGAPSQSNVQQYNQPMGMVRIYYVDVFCMEYCFQFVKQLLKNSSSRKKQISWKKYTCLISY